MSLEIIRLCQRLCSSSAALSDSLHHLAQGELVSPQYRTKSLELAAKARATREHGKIRALQRVLEEHREHVIVFSEHLPTLHVIREHVMQHGRQPIVYKGGLSRAERASKRVFEQSRNGVLISTRAGTEGLNLQFCNVLVNYELPWNPMIVEQRIGRIHRIGQKRDAHIISLAAEGTIEAHVLTLLDKKIKLFELVVGELDVILGDFGGAETMEQRVTAEFLKANSERELSTAVDAIGDDIARSRSAGLDQERLNSDVSGDDNAMLREREFAHLPIPARVRLGFGTKHLDIVGGIRARQETLGHRRRGDPRGTRGRGCSRVAAVQRVWLAGLDPRRDEARTRGSTLRFGRIGCPCCSSRSTRPPRDDRADLADSPDRLGDRPSHHLSLLDGYVALAGGSLTLLETDLYQLNVPKGDEGKRFGGRSVVRLAFTVDALELDDRAEMAIVGGSFVNELIDAIRGRGSRLLAGWLVPQAARSERQDAPCRCR